MGDDPTKNLDPLQQILARLDSFGSRFGSLEGNVDSRLSSLEEKVESRLRDELHTEISGLRTELHTEISGLRTEMGARFDKVEAEASEFRHDVNLGLHKVDRRIEVVAKELVNVGADIRILEEQFEKVKA